MTKETKIESAIVHENGPFFAMRNGRGITISVNVGTYARDLYQVNIDTRAVAEADSLAALMRADRKRLHRFLGRFGVTVANTWLDTFEK